MPLTEIEKAYMAGFVDGEGCISFRSVKKKGKEYITPSIEVTNTYKKILLIFKKYFGGNIYLNKDFRPTRKDCWHWTIASIKARDCIKILFPYLRIKKPQAKLVLSLKRFSNQKRDKLGRIKRVMTKKDFEENKKLKDKLHKLNKRGR